VEDSAHTLLFSGTDTNKRNARDFGLLKCECFVELSVRSDLNSFDSCLGVPLQI
jgi:hypothetical protein